MQGMGNKDEKCPFEFNFDPTTFKVGDMVSYRVSERFADMPFVGTLLEVHDDYVVISPNDPGDPDRRMRGTRESRPEVSAAEALG
ncbi:MAG TPA: hypothetical protein VFM32_04910 [Spongiibacteraceae bacterium]|nr:hypothetical protein [Spongiibacteraceae bacterium]